MQALGSESVCHLATNAPAAAHGTAPAVAQPHSGAQIYQFASSSPTHDTGHSQDGPSVRITYDEAPNGHIYQLAASTDATTARMPTAASHNGAATTHGAAPVVSQALGGHAGATGAQNYQLASSSPTDGSGGVPNGPSGQITYDEAASGHIYQLAASTPIDETTPCMPAAAGDGGARAECSSSMQQAYDGAMNRQAYTLASPAEPYTHTPTDTDSMYALASSTPTDDDGVDASDGYATVQEALHMHQAQYSGATGRQTCQPAGAAPSSSATDGHARAFALTDYTQPTSLRVGFAGAAVSRTISNLSTASHGSAWSGPGNEAPFVFTNELRSVSGAGTPTSRTTSDI